ncbi:hypothetical protein ACFSHT_22075 [Paraburkholderia silviterrae]|uniref:hypothetical protein n=1 Tax=Paraburkholderia silviterrae TaxID=2528715 RepID=UPI0026A9EEE5
MASQCVSIAMIGGHFTLFAYLAPYLQALRAPDATTLAALFVAVAPGFAGWALRTQRGGRGAPVETGTTR